MRLEITGAAQDVGHVLLVRSAHRREVFGDFADGGAADEERPVGRWGCDEPVALNDFG